MLIAWLYILSYNLETLKEVAFLTGDYHDQYYITTTVNNLMTVLIRGVRGQKSSQSLTALSRVTTLWLKQPNLFLSVIYSYGIVFIDKMADFSARSQSIRFSLVCAP